MRRGIRTLPGAVIASLLAGCFGPEPPTVDAEISRRARMGYEAFVSGDIGDAGRHYAMALDRARRMGVDLEIGNAAYNLAACRIETGAIDAALGLLSEAEFFLRRADSGLADLLLLRARAHRIAGDGAAAVTDLESVSTDGQARPEPGHRVSRSVLLGEIALDRGDRDAAGRELAAALSLAGSTADDLATITDPGCCGLAARLRRAEDAGAAAALYARQAELWREAGNHRPMARSLTEAGDCWIAAGLHRKGAECLYRAAACYQGLGDREQKTEQCGRAMDAAERAGAGALKQKIDFLRSEPVRARAR